MFRSNAEFGAAQVTEFVRIAKAQARHDPGEPDPPRQYRARKVFAVAMIAILVTLLVLVVV